MAKIAPFRGICFNPQKITLSEVVTPPYDVISKEQQQAYYDRHPNNVIRLDKNRPTDQDTPGDNPHTRASAHFRKWMEDGILIEDSAPAFYVTTIDFALNGRKSTRFGLIATVRLEPFSSGVVLPHEQTFSKTKTERLELMKACHANFSHIFSVFSDQNKILDILKSAISDSSPDEVFTDDAGHEQKMWRITDPAIHETVRKGFEDYRLFIADGHHRYETALNYRQWVKENTPGFDENHPANFIMMYLCAVEDPGLIILPTHRLLSGIPETDRKALLRKAEEWFDIEAFAVSPDAPDNARIELAGAMDRHRRDHVIGLVMRDAPAYYALTLKKGVMQKLFAGQIPEPLMGLDVTVLTQLVLIRMMGFDKNDLDNESLINYTSKNTEAVESVRRGAHDIAFILNPPTNEQVRLIAEAGHTMPRKTTFYYPKVITGQVMRKLT